MMRRKAILAIVGVFSLCIAQAAWAQPRWGRGRVPAAGACFYEDANYGGRYFCAAPGEEIRRLAGRMGDEISSIRLLGAADVIVFRDSNMRGRSARFDGDVRDLRRGGWNDQISSIVVGRRDARGRGAYDDRGRGAYDDRGRGAYDDRGRGGDDRARGVSRGPVWGRTAPVPRQGACFYEDSGFRGDYFCLARGDRYESLPRGFNDRISSVRVFGSAVQIFRDSDFRGRSTEIRRDVSNLRGSWKDTVSSIRVF